MSGVRRSDNSEEAAAFYSQGNPNYVQACRDARAAQLKALRLSREALEAAGVAVRALNPTRPTPTQRRLANDALQKIQTAADALAALGEGG